MDKSTKIAMAMAILAEPTINRDWVWEGLQMPGSNDRVINGRVLGDRGHQPLALMGSRVGAVKHAEDLLQQGLSAERIATRTTVDLSNQRMAQICDENGLTQCINRNRSQLTSELGAKTKSAVTTAMIGAAYMSGGLDMAERVIRRLGIIN
ncbi:Hypothetical protein R9X50_00598600 [Acrodontium crateriforme]|uniref:RNase III domain-containing protein n=1 Tax=Acrodontium crateriforme TaxID=150365 RepID=A0AAQ3R6F5_9PEZI|nr:Hypothetical protein R9X50_00598600 [Acrodontium crateriforme]